MDRSMKGTAEDVIIDEVSKASELPATCGECVCVMAVGDHEYLCNHHNLPQRFRVQRDDERPFRCPRDAIIRAVAEGICVRLWG